MSGDLVERWEEFLRKYYWEDVIELANVYPERRSLYVRFEDLLRYDIDLADNLLNDPDEALLAANEALRSYDIQTGVSLENAVVRIVEIPSRLRIRDIRSEDIGKLICVDGLVLKATEVRPRIVRAAFECPLCHNIFFVPVENRFEMPERCEICERKARGFKLSIAKSTFINAQKIRIQEAPEELRGGELPQTIDVNLDEDLTGIVSPGDRVTVIGILRSYPIQRSPFFGMYIDAVSIEKKEEEFEEMEITEEDERKIKELASLPDVYERLKNSIAPFIYGYDRIKEALLLQLFGGVPKEMPDGTRIRGDIHVLLVGDPGVAKSQLLTHIVELSPRGIYTGGKSATSAGLTATAVKDEFGEGRWTLEAGALVLADKGIAAIDEIDKMDKRDRDAMHEVLEQQTVSIAKAGITARLNARCALLAAANPKLGRFDRFTPISEQINLPPTLLSRFDLIFTMMDEPDETTDRKTAEHILDSHTFGEILMRNRENSCEDDLIALIGDLLKGKNGGNRDVEDVASAAEGDAGDASNASNERDASNASNERNERKYVVRSVEEIAERIKGSEVIRRVSSAVPAELLRKYVAYARKNVNPVLSEGARRRFLEFYINLRRQSYGDTNAPVPVTARQLEALVRLGEARARAFLRDVVTEEDAECVIDLVSYCLNRVFVDPETGKLDVDVVSIGMPKTRRDRMKTLIDIIKSLSSEYNSDVVPLEEVLDAAEERGIERQKAEELIEKLKREGIIFSPRNDMLKLV